VFLPQEGFLLRGSLGDNLRLAADRSDAELVGVLARAGLDIWVAALPEGLHTPIADRGANLSAGERQLVALTGVVLTDPAVATLDEATADIDRRTEALVANALDRLTIGRTLLIVAHRPATARRCDRVVNLDAVSFAIRSPAVIVLACGSDDGSDEASASAAPTSPRDAHRQHKESLPHRPLHVRCTRSIEWSELPSTTDVGHRGGGRGGRAGAVAA
jgi:ABC-type protease/lipase transport system fused ATPase/permease subunit